MVAGAAPDFPVSVSILLPMTIVEASMTVVAGWLVERQVAPARLLALASLAGALAAFILTRASDAATGECTKAPSWHQKLLPKSPY